MFFTLLSPTVVFVNPVMLLLLKETASLSTTGPVKVAVPWKVGYAALALLEETSRPSASMPFILLLIRDTNDYIIILRYYFCGKIY